MTYRGGSVRTALVLFVIAILVSACGSAGESQSASQAASGAASASASASQVKNGGTLNVLLKQDEGQGFDPAILTFSTGFVISQQMFDSLAEIQPDGTITPSLATGWDISPDNLTYTFHIRQGVKFHDGTNMTAKDVKCTIDRIMDPSTKSPRASLYSSVSQVTASDDQTVVIQLSEPFSPLLSALADITAGIVPCSAVGDANFFKHPVGTGAFKLESWTQGQSVKLVANPEYWDAGKPHLAGITFTFNADDNARSAALQAGDVNFLYDGPAPMLKTLQDDSSVDVYMPQGQMSWLYFLMNPNKKPFDDVRVRQAIYWALDRQQLADLCMPGMSNVLNAGFLPPTYWAANKEVKYQQNLDKARQLLADAGYANGFSFQINSLTGWDFQNCTAQAIQQQLKPLKIDAKVQIMDAGQMAAQWSAPDLTSDAAFDSQVLGFSGTIDPDERFQQTFLPGGGTNWAHFSDDQVTQLATEARQTTDRAKRAELYAQAQSRLAEVGPYAFLYNYYKFDATQSYVKGYVFNPQLISYRQLRDVWLDQ